MPSRSPARPPSRCRARSVSLFRLNKSESFVAREEREKKVTMYGYAMLPNRRGSEHCGVLSGRHLVQEEALARSRCSCSRFRLGQLGMLAAFHGHANCQSHRTERSPS